MSAPVRAAIYARLSRNRGDERSASTQRQEAECRKLAEARGWTVDVVELDDDVSAYSGRPRPGYDRLMAAVQAGQVDAIVAWAPDRLHRSPVELETFIDAIEAAGTEVATVQAGRVDLASPAGRMQARMLGNVARYESEHRSARTRLAHDQIAAEGRWKGGRRPYGYEPQPGGTMVVVEHEAEVIREAARRVVAGERVGSVANDFERRGFRTVTGAPWRSQTLRRIIASPTVAGRRVAKGEDVGPAQWPAILTPAEVIEVRAVLDGGAKRGRVARIALLAGGRLVCRKCSAPMSTARRGNGGRLYRCLSCYAQVAAEPLEDLVVTALLYRLDAADLPDAPAHAPSIDVTAIEDDMSQLASDHGEGLISRAEWVAARTPLVARLDAARASVAATVGGAAVVGLTGRGAASKAWPTLTLDRRQAALDVLVDAVVIAPATKRGPGLDPERVDIRWRV